MRAKVAMIEMGMAREMTRVLRILRKKKRRTNTARAPP
jgi:hypothetical protein